MMEVVEIWYHPMLQWILVWLNEKAAKWENNLRGVSMISDKGIIIKIFIICSYAIFQDIHTTPLWWDTAEDFKIYVKIF